MQWTKHQASLETHIFLDYFTELQKQDTEICVYCTYTAHITAQPTKMAAEDSNSHHTRSRSPDYWSPDHLHLELVTPYSD